MNDVKITNIEMAPDHIAFTITNTTTNEACSFVLRSKEYYCMLDCYKDKPLSDLDKINYIIAELLECYADFVFPTPESYEEGLDEQDFQLVKEVDCFGRKMQDLFGTVVW